MDMLIKKFEDFNVFELYDIMKMRSEVFVVEQNCPYLDMDGADIDSFHLIGIEDEEICAYLRIPLKGVTYEKTSIGRVLVPKSCRGKGYAKKILMKAIEYIFDEMGEDEIEISAQVSSEIYLEDDIEHIHMNLVKEK